MELKSLLISIFKTTPVRIALGITLLQGVFLVASIFNGAMGMK
jgi:hypothetical protein